LLQQVWAENKKTILAGLIAAILASILVGVFLRKIAETISRWASSLFHFLFDRFASAPLLRLRYDKAYRETLAAALQKLVSSNIVDREVRLERVYVPVGLTEETRGADRATFEDLIQWDEDRRRRQAARAVEPWDAIRRFHRLVVLGEPGAGKTTYLTYLAFMCARRERLPAYTPIFLRLRDLAGVTRLEDALPAEFARRGFPNAARFLHRQLEAGRCLILLDGLDEVISATEHERIVGLVQEFADSHVRDAGDPPSGGNIVVVSSRTYSYENGPQLTGFTKTMVMDFSDEAIERFVHNWFGVGEKGPLAGELLAELNRNRRFKELARNPLLLLLIANHFERDRNLPDLRADLYRDCINTRIIRWNTVRGTHRGRFGETDKWRMLRELALDIYREQWRDLLDQEQLLGWLERFAGGLRLPEKTTPADLLDEVARTSGLLQERAIDRYGFSHQTLQEYFAAEGIVRLGPDAGAALVGEHLTEPRWQEVIFLYCGLADHAGPLLRRIVGGAEARGKDAWLQAGRCMAEGAKDVAPAVCCQVADGLVALLRRAEAGEDGLLTPDESAAAADWLAAFAAEDLPDTARMLLESGASHDALLAARLLSELPAGQEAALRSEVSRRMAGLAASGDAAERRVASAAMGWMAVLEPEAVKTLRANLAQADPAARAEAARALGRLGAGDEPTVAELLRLYNQDGADVARHAALEALLALGRAADVGMALVPAGEFLMGSADDDRDAEDREKPQHRIYLPAYYLDRTPVTNAAFRRFVEAGGYGNAAYWPEASTVGRWKNGAYIDYDKKPRTEPIYWRDAKWNGAEQPVVGVSWYEALAYARWADKRLPTEAEWEKAASWAGEPGSGGAGERGKKRRYPWGDEWDPKRCNTEESGIKRTTPVGTYSPASHPELVAGGDSPCGAADMAGNVFEWCQSAYRPYPYDPDDGREDLGGGDEVIRVLRGGSWYTDRKWARCAYRDGDIPRHWLDIGGFRCCCATSSPSSGSGS
jgi:formylglycine-generating enzyme required for sulfatase activity